MSGVEVLISLISFTAIYNYNEPSLQVLPPVKLEPPVPSGEAGIEIIADGVQPLDCNTRPGFGDFRAEYACPRSPEWVLWTKAANEMMSSEVFAELIEANTKDIIQVEGSPTPAALLSLARDLKVDTRKLVGRKYNPTTGEMNIQYVEENVEGSTKIPEKFWIGVPVSSSRRSHTELMRRGMPPLDLKMPSKTAGSKVGLPLAPAHFSRCST